MRTDDLEGLREYIRELEGRLSDYHTWLEQSIEERDRFSLNAAWGVHGELFGSFALLIGFAVLVVGLKNETWWQSTAAVMFCVFVPGAVLRWSNRQRIKDADRMAALPEWKHRDPGFD